MKYAVPSLSSMLTLVSVLMLSACGGGGGGGGGGDPAPDDTGDDDTEPVVFEQQQNLYLPLIADAGMSYSVVGDEMVSSDAVAEPSTDVAGASDEFEVAMEGVSFYYTSTPTEAGFWGVTGPFSMDLDENLSVSINSMIFNQAIPLWRDTFTENVPVSLTDLGYQAEVKATLRFNGIAFSNPTVTITVSDATVTPMGETLITTDYGALVAQLVNVAITGNGSVNDTSFVVTYLDSVYIAKGIGIIARASEIKYDDNTIFELSQTMSTVINLPKPLRFTSAGGMATLASSDSAVKFADGTSLSRTNYQVLNGDDISWLTVEEMAGDLFGISANGTAPGYTQGSEVFYFQRKSGADDHIPLHISLTE